MSILCLGLNHQSAPLNVLEQVSFGADELKDFLGTMRRESAIQEIAGISTCNRTEFYAVSPDYRGAREALLAHIGEFRGGELPERLSNHSYTHRNDNAARHLFRVAAGVDSLIVGESQILGQLREAYETAVSIGTVDGMLNSLMMRAISFGRKVRSTTNIGKGNVSVASVSLKAAIEFFPDLAERRLLVLGAGETARLAGRHFHKHGVAEMTICNRTHGNAVPMVEEFEARYISVDRMQTAVEDADVVVCAVGAPHYIITRMGLEHIMGARQGRPMLLIDLSVPRNIDPEVNAVAGVKLVGLGDLEAIADDNRRQRLEEIEQVDELIDRETSNFMRWIQMAETSRMITQLRRRWEETRQRHLDRHGKNLSAQAGAEIDRFSNSLMRSLLHDLTLNIRQIDPDAPDGRVAFETACRLFNIDPESLKE